ncbi:hypothetical protein [Aureimonas psammosilenae]|uniref:hypothetical protein n=1 Tax=Aureimonas psammosilenae TaxID=2495496 RepID=UPI001260C05F|nr:hypothetical protein [Aureimonas psammosilenae]
MLDAVIDDFDPAPTGSVSPPPPPPPTTGTGALARTFVEMLLVDAGKASTAGSPSTFLDTGDLAEFGLDEEVDTGEAPAPVVTLSVDEAATAILLAARFEEAPGTLRALRRESPVLVVEVPYAGMMEIVDRVLRVCALGRSTQVMSMGALDAVGASGRSGVDRRRAAILFCDVDTRGRAILERRALVALSIAIPVCALSVAAARAVPEPLRAVADRVVSFGGWSPPLLSVLVQAVTGDPTEVPAEAWVGAVTLDDLRMSVSAQRGAAGSLERLRSSVLRRLSRGQELPDLADLHGYGEAKTIGLEMLADLRAYREGTIG